ncbi:MAG TPA: PQQ-binding-like beta-propeller repeat protein [Rhizomicrobium sp.]|jgi:alcohol dehydrogenase (cytochrome c)|nr:PQQ-binding-like beta-propeller repeat protein [Rhizomicrobium sp.]
MGLKIGLLSTCLVAGLSAGVLAQTAYPPQPGADWPIYGGSYNNQRYSSLKQVTPANAHNLVTKWVYHVDGLHGLEGVPVVANGVMYISGFNRIDAVDARTGNIIWKFQRPPATATYQRGAAVANNRVYITTTDGHILALDARTGAQIWESSGGPQSRFSGIPPLIAGGKIIVGGNQPHGYLQAYDEQTGQYAWTWSPLPEKGQPGYDSWGGQVPGGAPMWIGGAYDPELKLVYYGTGQPNPQWSGRGRPGDNLYSDSIVALDVATGKLKWYFQNTPHDTHDYDSTEIVVLTDQVFKGKPRKLLLQANRNGYFYVLDRTNGAFLQATPFVSRVDWGTVDPKTGKGNPDPAHEPTVKGTITCPSTAGATNWPSPAYNPATGLFYVMAVEGCGVNTLASSAIDAETSYLESPRDKEAWQLYTRAIDPVTGKTAWDYKQVRSNHYGPGLLTTEGGVVFSPEQFGQVSMLDAKTGESLWHFNTGDLITASPVTYSVDGKQYFAIESGTNVFAFGLGEATP